MNSVLEIRPVLLVTGLVALLSACDGGNTNRTLGTNTALGGAGGSTANAEGTGGSGQNCVPGATQDCVGVGRCPGAQVCLDDGSKWGSCDCGDSSGSGGTSSTSVVATTTGGADASGGASSTTIVGAPTGGATGASGGGAATGGTPTTAVGGATGGTPTTAGGGSATGGASSTMGGSSAGGAKTCSDPMLIDDFEDGDTTPCAMSNWVSGWWMADDGLGTKTPSTNAGLPAPLTVARTGSLEGLHVQGSGFSDWGLVVGLTFDNPDDTVPRMVDLSTHTGVTFWVRGTGAIRFQLATSDTQTAAHGGSCTTSCDINFEVSTITLSSTWTRQQVAFSSLYNRVFARSASTSDLKRAMTFMFLTATSTFDVWIDDMSFY